MHLNLMKNYEFKAIYIPTPLPFPSRLASAEPLGWWRRSRWGPGGLYCGRSAAVWRRLALARGTRVYSLFSAITNTLNTDHSVQIHTRADGSLRGRAHWHPSDRNLAVKGISKRVLVFFHGIFFLGWCENMADMIPTVRATLPKSVSGNARVPLRAHTVLRQTRARGAHACVAELSHYTFVDSLLHIHSDVCNVFTYATPLKMAYNPKLNQIFKIFGAECFDWKSQRLGLLIYSLLCAFWEVMLLIWAC